MKLKLSSKIAAVAMLFGLAALPSTTVVAQGNTNPMMLPEGPQRDKAIQEKKSLDEAILQKNQAELKQETKAVPEDSYTEPLTKKEAKLKREKEARAKETPKVKQTVKVYPEPKLD